MEDLNREKVRKKEKKRKACTITSITYFLIHSVHPCHPTSVMRGKDLRVAPVNEARSDGLLEHQNRPAGIKKPGPS